MEKAREDRPWAVGRRLSLRCAVDGGKEKQTRKKKTKGEQAGTHMLVNMESKSEDGKGVG